MAGTSKRRRRSTVVVSPFACNRTMLEKLDQSRQPDVDCYT